MITIGNVAINLGLILCGYSVVMSLLGARWRRSDFVASAEHAALAVWGVTLVASAVLVYALVSSDLSLEYVASYTSTTLPLQYRVAAFWGGQQGSLLFWQLILSSATAVVVLQNRNKNRDLMPYVTAVLMMTSGFFLHLLCFVTPPFKQFAVAPMEGHDLNPLLQNYWMTIHPPALYLGYVGFAVPFAFAIAALATGNLGDGWIRTTRRWALSAWFFLSLGNLFGAQWAYLVLGWGGYWAWDPVENASFMPWLTGTAYLHSVMIQEKKNMLKVWNMSLIILTFALTIFGTFLTRSGVIASVHAFTQSGLGPYFLWYLALVGTVSLALLLWRLPLLRSENELDSLLSRESSFLFNNLILVGMAFTVFWGTMFPVISEWVRGVKITVGPPFFNKVNAPLGLILLFLTGVGPIIAWRRASWSNLQRNFAMPFLVGLAGAALSLALGGTRWWAAVSFGLCAFVLATIVVEYYRGVRARQAMVHESAPVALARLFSKNRRRYGGYIIHLGVVMIYLGITGTAVFREETQVTLNKGQTFEIGDYSLRYNDLEQHDSPHVATLLANVSVFQDGKLVDTLRPEKRFYKKPQQPSTEVAIRSTFLGDLYLVLGSYDSDTSMVTILAYINPLVGFLWVGGWVVALGTLAVMLPTRAASPVAATAGARNREEALAQ